MLVYQFRHFPKRAVGCQPSTASYQFIFYYLCAPSVGESGLPIDGRAYDAAVLGPGAVVVTHLVVSQDLGQHEPGMRRALADAAIGDDLSVAGDALAAVYLPQLLHRLEGAVALVDGTGPADIGGARDVPAPLCSLLGQVGRRQ